MRHALTRVRGREFATVLEGWYRDFVLGLRTLRTNPIFCGARGRRQRTAVRRERIPPYPFGDGNEDLGNMKISSWSPAARRTAGRPAVGRGPRTADVGIGQTRAGMQMRLRRV